MSRMDKRLQEVGNVNIKRLWFIGALATFVLVALLARLFYIQVIKYDLYTTEVNKQRQMHIPLNSGRGQLLDRNLIPLTDRTEKPMVVIFPHLFAINDESIALLKTLTGLSEYELRNRLTTGSSLVELPLQEEMKAADYIASQARGLFVVNKRLRYDEMPRLSHVIGYISQADKTGLFGIEKALDNLLRGKETRSLAAVVDGRKRLLPGEGYTLVDQSTDQRHVRLTVDYHIQALAEDILDKEKLDGAVVISKIDTGELLAIASRPNFDPNNISQHLNSSGDELYNKALQLTFPPGSIFKIVVAAAALEAGLVDLEEAFFCGGLEEVGNIQIKCNSYSIGGHGHISFREAFAESCNSTFIQLGQRIGAEHIISMARRLGLGEKVGIGLLEEEAGNLPAGDQLLGPAIGNISIGQGVIEVTPLQINQLTQIIANGGVKKPLYIIDAVLDDGYEVLERINSSSEEVLLQGEVLEMLQFLMEQVMQEGTGSEVGELAGVTAGKTGTAQASARGEAVLHAWFTGYYPADNPQYAITVFLQNGGSGGKVAVPIFKQLIEGINALGY